MVKHLKQRCSSTKILSKKQLNELLACFDQQTLTTIVSRKHIVIDENEYSRKVET
ncbi:MAG: hypothetical protein ACI35P_14050 [Bacillus sp. (in: firmicutes)]